VVQRCHWGVVVWDVSELFWFDMRRFSYVPGG
jgi:hypothetical protein